VLEAEAGDGVGERPTVVHRDDSRRVRGDLDGSVRRLHGADARAVAVIGDQDLLRGGVG
jgi:hypothetical protein